MSNSNTDPPARNTRSAATAATTPTNTPAPAPEPTLAELMRAIGEVKSSLNRQITDIHQSFNDRFAQNDQRYNDLLGRIASLESTPRSTDAPVVPPSTSVPLSPSVSRQTQPAADIDPSTAEHPQTTSAADVSSNPDGWWDTQFRAARQDGRGPPRPQDARVRESAPTAYNQPPPPEKVLLCNPKHLGEFHGDPATLEDFIGRVHDIARMNPSRTWELAVRAAIPAALQDSAANWHKGLTDPEIRSMASLSDYFKAMRKAFPVNRSALRKLAQGRKWDPHRETAMAYSFDKVKLLRQLYGRDADESNIVWETLEGLVPTLRATIRLPRNNFTVEELRIELGDQEATWREATGIQIGDTPPSDSNSTSKPGSTSSMVATRSRSEARQSIPTSSAIPSGGTRISTPAQNRPMGRRGRPISEDFDPSRLGRGRDPESGKDLMFYRVPDSTTTMWCHRPCRQCGGDHFDFAHQHCVSQTTPSVQTVTADDYDYPVVEDEDGQVQGSDFLGGDVKPLARATRRDGVVIALDRDETVGTGQAYRRHIPLTTHLHVNDTSSPPLSSLLDTGASLSVIDAGLLSNLGGQPTGSPMRILGLGDKTSLGWATITFFLPSHDSLGQPVFLECTLDFHVIQDFAPQMCLGLDFITKQGVTIHTRNDRATLGRYAFRVFEKMPAPFAKEAELCAVSDCLVPAQSMAWIPVDVACLAPGVDYTVHPRLTVSSDESVQLAGPMAVATKDTKHFLVANYGTQAITLARRTPIADATAALLGDASSTAEHTFSLPPPLPQPSLVTMAASQGVWSAQGTADYSNDTAQPLDLFDAPHDAVNDLTRDAATVVVDDHFRVGADAEGKAHPDITRLLRSHTAAFALDGRPGRVNGEEMTIPLVPGAPIHSEPPRRASPEKRAAMDSALDQLLEWDVVEPSSSPISFPVLMIRQGAKWRFCVDYRKLNEVTIPDRYPLPTTDAVFQTLLGKRWFSALDALRGYHQQPVKEEDRWKTAFVCHRGLYQYKTVPFGLRNAPAVFQRLMDKILGQLRWKDAVVYIDDIVVATVTLEEHLRALDTLLTRATTVGLKFSPSKCTFGVPSLTLLGRKVSGAGVAVWQDRASAVQTLSPPRTLQDLYHVLGLFGYYRAFIPRFAEIASPLTQLTRGWRYERRGDRTVLVNPSGDSTPASRVQLEWGPTQEKSFAALKEAVASPPTLAHPDPGRPYVLYVDASKMAFAAILHQVHVVDSPPADPSPAAHITSIPLLPVESATTQWSAWLRADPHFRSVLRHLDDPGSEWVLRDDLLIRRVDGRIALPENALPLVLRAVHDDNGHFGFAKSYLALTRHFWRPRLIESVQAWIRHCPACQSTKLGRRVGELDLSRDSLFPFEAISVDLALGLPRTKAGRDAILVIECLFSRMMLLHPCSSTIDALGIAAVLSDRVLRYGWNPRRLISDSESKMVGSTMQALARSMGAVLEPSPPHHQQANPVERSIQTVQTVLKALSVSGHTNWDTRIVPAAELAINSTPNLTTGYRPFDLVFLAQPSIVHAVFDASDPEGVGSFGERLAAANARLEDAYAAIRRAREGQKSRYDRRRAPLPNISVGDTAYVRLKDRPMGGVSSHKLAKRKLGPFPVRRVLSDHRVELELPADMGGSAEFSVDQLDLCPSSPDPFVSHRSGGTASDGDVEAPVDLNDADGDAADVEADLTAPRTRLAPSHLRDFHIGVAHAGWPVEEEWLRGPIFRPRDVLLGDVSVTLTEKPVAFLSRLTTVSEKRLVAPELELSCLAWAFAQWAHLLEGAAVTVVTDHAPMGAMLTSSSSTVYGPVISRCRALLLPHLQNLRFHHRAGRSHTNVDSLSRLVAPEEDDDPGRSSI
ncbi:hypothetical protein CF319_g3496 [Tilletia indica]|nr:hypothetical protein CF319_g3496 [Tilletia indica]